MLQFLQGRPPVPKLQLDRLQSEQEAGGRPKPKVPKLQLQKLRMELLVSGGGTLRLEQLLCICTH